MASKLAKKPTSDNGGMKGKPQNSFTHKDCKPVSSHGCKHIKAGGGGLKAGPK